MEKMYIEMIQIKKIEYFHIQSFFYTMGRSKRDIKRKIREEEMENDD